MMIDDISPFRENQTYQEGLNEWKKIKLSRKELKEYELKKTKMSMI
jgi:hypothetical protein